MRPSEAPHRRGRKMHRPQPRGDTGATASGWQRAARSSPARRLSRTSTNRTGAASSDDCPAMAKQEFARRRSARAEVVLWGAEHVRAEAPALWPKQSSGRSPSACCRAPFPRTRRGVPGPRWGGRGAPDGAKRTGWSGAATVCVPAPPGGSRVGVAVADQDPQARPIGRHRVRPGRCSACRAWIRRGLRAAASCRTRVAKCMIREEEGCAERFCSL